MNATLVNLRFILWFEHMIYKHSRCPFGSSITSQDHTHVLCSLLSIIAQFNSLKSTTNLSQNPSQLHSLAHHTVCNSATWMHRTSCMLQVRCIPVSLCYRCDDWVLLLSFLKFVFFLFVFSFIQYFCCSWSVPSCWNHLPSHYFSLHQLGIVNFIVLFSIIYSLPLSKVA